MQNDITVEEQDCLSNCMDKLAFFDNTTYEIESAQNLAMQQGKPKKAFMYYNRRIADLTDASNVP